MFGEGIVEEIVRAVPSVYESALVGRRPFSLTWLHVAGYSGFGILAISLLAVSAGSLLDGILSGQWALGVSASVLGVVAGLGIVIEAVLGVLVDLGILRRGFISRQLGQQNGNRKNRQPWAAEP